MPVTKSLENHPFSREDLHVLVAEIILENPDEFQRVFARDLGKIKNVSAEEVLIRRLFCDGLSKYLDNVVVHCGDTLNVSYGDVYDTLLNLPKADSLLAAPKTAFLLPTEDWLKSRSIHSGFVLFVSRPVFSSVYFPPYKNRRNAETEGVALRGNFIVWDVAEGRVESWGSISATRMDEVRLRYAPFGLRNSVAPQLWTFVTDRAAVQVAYGTPRFQGEKARNYFKFMGPGPW